VGGGKIGQNIKNIIFDLGDVLVRFDPDWYLKSEGLNNVEVELVRDKFFLSKEWAYLDIGIITRDEAKEVIISRNKKYKYILSKFIDNYPNMYKSIDCNVEILNELKNRRYKLYFLSNFHKKAFLTIREQFKFFKLFDDGVVSAFVKLLKPYRSIYLKLVEKNGIKPRESIFIDDARANIEAAEKLGFGTIHLNNPAELSYALSHMGII